MITLNGISKSFGKHLVLDNIGFSVNDCSIYGLIGYNGAGKTTLLNIISGLYKADKGTVNIDVENKKCVPFDNVDVKRSLFYVTDEPYYFAGANLLTMRNFFCGFYPTWSDESFKKLIDVFGIDPNKKIGDFSKGMKRQAAIIIGLSSKARYLLMDESFDGLDPNIRTIVSNILAEYIAETEATVIAASHNLYELENICDTVGMINGKHLIYSEDIDNIKSKVKKYSLACDKAISTDIFNGLNIKFIKQEGQFCSFQSSEDPEKIKALITANAKILNFDCKPMNLNEIFIYETEGKESEIEGIFQ